MKREIKFRGKRIDNGEWVCGYFSDDCEITAETKDESCGFYTSDAYDIIQETIGQFTGLKDKNGIDIYEGDIINIGEIPDKQHLIVPDIRFMNDILHEVDRHVWLEVIGNIHDNPELLK